MEPIFDKTGQTIAWLEDKIIYNLKGDAAALLSGGVTEEIKNIVSFTGRHLGIFNQGYFHDHNGDVTAFLESVTKTDTEGPVLPFIEVSPSPPVPAIPLVFPSIPVPPASGVPSLEWSKISWEEFLKG